MSCGWRIDTDGKTSREESASLPPERLGVEPQPHRARLIDLRIELVEQRRQRSIGRFAELAVALVRVRAQGKECPDIASTCQELRLPRYVLNPLLLNRPLLRYGSVRRRVHG